MSYSMQRGVVYKRLLGCTGTFWDAKIIGRVKWVLHNGHVCCLPGYWVTWALWIEFISRQCPVLAVSVGERLVQCTGFAEHVPLQVVPV